MRLWTWIVVIAVVVALIVLSQSLFIVSETEQVIITQFGEPKSTITTPGLHAKVPFTQTVTRFEKRILVSDAPPTEFFTLDKERLVVDHVSRWRISDPLLFFKTVSNEAGAQARLQPIVTDGLRTQLAANNFSDIISAKREIIMDTVAAAISERVRAFGIELIDVRIKRADLPEEVEQSVFNRMKAERNRIALGHRAEGQKKKDEIEGGANRLVAQLQGEAEGESRRIRGQGDAQAIKIFADAFGQDPEFYAFVRTLEAYEEFLGTQSTLVLPADSELFKYLRSPEAP